MLRRSRSNAFTLVEVLVSMAILGIMVTGIVAGFTQSHKTAEWSAYSLAAQSIASQSVEQTRGANWDPNAWPPVDEITNRPPQIEVLDVPVSGTNIVYATNRTSVRLVMINPPLKEISVEVTWRFFNRGVFTNSILTYRAPNQ